MLDEQNVLWSIYVSTLDCQNKNERGQSSNVIQHMAFALTSIETKPAVIFGSHIDQFNCCQPGYDMVVCIYLHFWDPVWGKWFHLAIICYSQSACHHFFLGEGSRAFLKQQLVDFHGSAPQWPKILSPQFMAVLFILYLVLINIVSTQHLLPH
jgi:hypothetical protein